MPNECLTQAGVENVQEAVAGVTGTSTCPAPLHAMQASGSVGAHAAPWLGSPVVETARDRGPRSEAVDHHRRQVAGLPHFRVEWTRSRPLRRGVPV